MNEDFQVEAIGVDQGKVLRGAKGRSTGELFKHFLTENIRNTEAGQVMFLEIIRHD